MSDNDGNRSVHDEVASSSSTTSHGKKRSAPAETEEHQPSTLHSYTTECAPSGYEELQQKRSSKSRRREAKAAVKMMMRRSDETDMAVAEVIPSSPISDVGQARSPGSDSVIVNEAEASAAAPGSVSARRSQYDINHILLPKSIDTADRAIQFLSHGVYINNNALLRSYLHKLHKYCAALKSSYDHPDSQAAISRLSRAGVYVIVLGCGKRNYHDEEMQMAVFGLLVALTPMCGEWNADLGAVEAAMYSAKLYPHNLRLQQRVMCFLGNLMVTPSSSSSSSSSESGSTRNPDADTFAALGGVEWLLDAMSRNSHEVMIQRGGCHLMRWICSSNPEISRSILEGGGMNLITTVLANHKSHKETVQFGCHAMRVLVQSLEEHP